MVRLLTIREIGGSVEPEDAKVDVSWAVGSDFEDAGDPEAGAGVVGVGVSVDGAEYVDVVVEGYLFVVDCGGLEDSGRVSHREAHR